MLQSIYSLLQADGRMERVAKGSGGATGKHLAHQLHEARQNSAVVGKNQAAHTEHRVRSHCHLCSDNAEYP